jgi:acid-sensing ion channel, other
MTRKIQDIAVAPRKKLIEVSKQLRTTKTFCVEYSDNSSIHGFRYLTEENRSLFEKIWWAIVILISFVLCGQLISELYSKWTESPVIVSFSEKATPITEIPFPAITICPETKADADLFRINEALNSLEANTLNDNE